MKAHAKAARQLVWAFKDSRDSAYEEVAQMTAKHLKDAIELAQRLQKEARRRQLQYIGKLLRSIDAEPIREALEKIENKHNQQQAMLHKLEILRDELIAKGDAALTDLLNEHPSADRQQLRNLIRAAQKEKEQNKPSKAYREIYQILKTLILED